MPPQPEDIQFAEIIPKGKNATFRFIAAWDERVRKHHLQLNPQALKLFDDLLFLLYQLTFAIGNNVQGVQPTFTRNTSVSQVLGVGAISCTRALRITKRLLLEGYFLEMQGLLRPVTEWSKIFVALEEFPDLADRIITRGSIKDANFRKIVDHNRQHILKMIDRDISDFSQRLHITKTHIQLMGRTADQRELEIGIAGWAAHKESFDVQISLLVRVAKNVVSMLARHFSAFPTTWFESCRLILKNDQSTSEPNKNTGA